MAVPDSPYNALGFSWQTKWFSIKSLSGWPERKMSVGYAADCRARLHVTRSMEQAPQAVSHSCRKRGTADICTEKK